MTGRAVPRPEAAFRDSELPVESFAGDTGLFFASSIEPRTSTDWIRLLKACSVPVAVTVTSSAHRSARI